MLLLMWLLMTWRNLEKANSLVTNSNPEECPTCRGVLGERWSVLHCGHSVCLECIELLLKNHCPLNVNTDRQVKLKIYSIMYTYYHITLAILSCKLADVLTMACYLFRAVGNRGSEFRVQCAESFQIRTKSSTWIPTGRRTPSQKI